MFSQGSWAKIWKIERHEKYASVKMSTQQKMNDEYKQDWGAYVSFVGEANKKICDVSEGDRIKIGRCGVSNKYDKEKNTTYTNYTVFDFELISAVKDNETVKEEKKKNEAYEATKSASDDELPF